MTFANPWFLALFLPLLAVAAWRLLRISRRTGLRFSAMGRLPARTSGWRAYATLVSPFVLLAGLALLTLAAARPRSPLGIESINRKEQRNVESISIVMVVDVSGSMAILDLARPELLNRLQRLSRTREFLTDEQAAVFADETRLAQVKKLFAEFVAKRPDDYIGLVTFGTYADTRCPLTTDHQALRLALEKVEIPRIEGEDMTAIGDGLGMALARLEKATTKSKVVILLSDGVHNVRTSVPPGEMAEIARRRDVKVYSIGVGTTSHFMPVIGEVRWPPERKIVGSVDATFSEEELKSLATDPQRGYFAVNDKEGLRRALEEIDRLEKTVRPLEEEGAIRWQEHARGVLGWGAGLTLLAMLLSLAAARRLA